MLIKGKAIKLGDSINTDLIISGRYKFSITDMKELSRHIFEDVDPNFGERIVSGLSILIGGYNFGCGSSREQAPLVIKSAGILAVAAKNFARIFYRNSINIGLPLIEADTDKIREADELEIDLEKGEFRNITQNKILEFKPLPKIMMRLLNDGGLVEHFKKYKTIKL